MKAARNLISQLVIDRRLPVCGAALAPTPVGVQIGMSQSGHNQEPFLCKDCCSMQIHSEALLFINDLSANLEVNKIAVVCSKTVYFLNFQSPPRWDVTLEESNIKKVPSFTFISLLLYILLLVFSLIFNGSTHPDFSTEFDFSFRISDLNFRWALWIACTTKRRCCLYNFHTVWIIYATFVATRCGATENGFGVAILPIVTQIWMVVPGHNRAGVVPCYLITWSHTKRTFWRELIQFGPFTSDCFQILDLRTGIN